MNKWQIICPLVAMAIVATLFASAHSRNHSRGMQAAIEQHLRTLLAELEKHADDERFPSLQTARLVLGDTETEKRIHVTGLFGTADLSYNPAQPRTGSDAVVLCARIKETPFVIQADQKVRRINESEFIKLRLIPLIPARH